MNIVPTNKSDISACSNLAKASDEDVKKNLVELLTWVQDINWPVAPLICERLKSIGIPLINPVKTILQGSDSIWKYWIITALISKMPKEIIISFEKELKDLSKKPTKEDTAEEVNIVAAEALKKFTKSA